MNLSSCCFVHSRNFTIGAQAILGIPEQTRSVIPSSKMTIFVLQRMKSALVITLFCSSASCRSVSSKVFHSLHSQKRFSIWYPASHWQEIFIQSLQRGFLWVKVITNFKLFLLIFTVTHQFCDGSLTTSHTFIMYSNDVLQKRSWWCSAHVSHQCQCGYRKCNSEFQMM